MNQKEIIQSLDDWGHLRMPFGEQRVIFDDQFNRLTLTSQVVRDALESYQSFHSIPLEYIASGIFPKLDSPSPVVTGIVDEPTKALFTTARCACPDYAAATAEAGVGNWKGCYGIGNFHCVNVHFLNDPPLFLTSFDTIWERFVDSYAEQGLLVTADQSKPANIEISFVQPDGGWIGLAIVGIDQTCQDRIWARFDRNYKPANLLSEWTTLIKHEIGHNCGLNHSQGGVMNPYIIPGLPVSWKGDVSHPLLVSRFGGVPIHRIPTSRTLVIAWENGDSTYEVLKRYATNEIPGGIFS